MAEYTMYTGDPEYYKKELEAVQAVTMDDIKNVYEKYIKDKPFVQTSFVPKGEVNLIAEGSVNAGIIEEDVTKAAEVKDVQIEEEAIVKTPSKIDRSVKPSPGPDPEVTLPHVWTSSLGNGIKVWGIEHNELPLDPVFHNHRWRASG